MYRWKNSIVLVLGLAKSGVAVAKCLRRLGAQVIANDLREICPEKDELEQLGVTVICGHHPDHIVTSEISLVVKNPGIPYHIAPIQKAMQLNIPVITEVEVAGALLRVPIIGITGTNGKTTTTALVGEMLALGGLNPLVAGNIGTALTEIVEKVEPDQWLVAELSSFQLKGTALFHPHVAVLLNVEEAHLDYHIDFKDYLLSKHRIFQNQTPRDFAVLNADSPQCRDSSGLTKAKVIWFSRIKEQERGVYIKRKHIYAKLGEHEERILPVDEVALCGSFNLENALAATAIALVCGCSISGVKKALASFTGVEHRLEYVKTIRGARYFNDSKATNAKAARMALESFEEPIIWIAGGLDRGIDFTELVPTIKQRVKMMITYGQTKDTLLERAREAGVQSISCDGVKDAVYIADRIATLGDVVLLSPACASWDMYTSFEERGSIFKQAVHSL